MYNDIRTRIPHSYKERDLVDHKYANCYVREYDDGVIDLISYHTNVVRAIPTEDGHLLECTGVYSRTTTSHISWFLREYFPNLNYYQMKMIANSNARMHSSGKVIYLEEDRKNG